MPDLHSLEDAATLYVLGQLTEAERTEFATRLAESAELRTLVRELEEGALATALASPQRRVPQRVWERIEKAVTEESKPRLMDFSLWFGWLRNGWAAAAACLVGWLIYALWPNQPVTPASTVAEVKQQPGGISADFAQMERESTISQPRAATNAELRTLQSNLLAMTRQNNSLRSQNVELARQAANLSQVLTQQQAMLSEPDRFKFFQLGPEGGGIGGSNAPVSPAMQRALFLAMARELGWLGFQSGSPLTNIGGVDFVDLRPGGGTTTQTNQPTDTETLPSDASEPSSQVASVGAIPGFIAGTNTFLAFDPSVMPPGCPVNFGFPSIGASGGGGGGGGYQVLFNPTVFTIPLFVTNFTISGGCQSPWHYQFPPTGLLLDPTLQLAPQNP